MQGVLHNRYYFLQSNHRCYNEQSEQVSSKLAWWSQLYQLNLIIQIGLNVPNISVKFKRSHFRWLSTKLQLLQGVLKHKTANALELLQSCAKLHFQSSNLNNLNFYL